MNTMGKEFMAKRIVEAVKHTLKVCKKTPIIMNGKKIQRQSRPRGS